MPNMKSMPQEEERSRCFDAFRRWLRANTQLGERPRGDAVARAKRVERDLFGGINLDAEYAQDRLTRVLQALEYSTEDARNHREPPEGVSFTFAPDEPRYYERVKAVLNGLHRAVELYRDFCA